MRYFGGRWGESAISVLLKEVSYDDVFDFMLQICKTVPLDVEYRRFYIEIVTIRYMCIVLRMNFDKSYGLVEEALENYA